MACMTKFINLSMTAANDDYFYPISVGGSKSHSMSGEDLECLKAEYEFLIHDINQAIISGVVELDELGVLYRKAFESKCSGLGQVYDSRYMAYLTKCEAINLATKRALLLKEFINESMDK